MRKIKIVHSADLHFDTAFKDVSTELSKINKEELREVFMKIIHLCHEKHVDIFLLSGDIFDNYTLNRETIYFIENAFKKIPKTRVFISPGNHDPYSKKSFYSLIDWPDNVYIFKGPLEKVFIEDLDINIWGAAFNEVHLKKSLLDGFKNSSSKIEIMVIHGEVTKGHENNEYNPITLDQIKNSGMDYIALGHRHSYTGVKKVFNTFYAYSGCPQGRGFDELSDKGVLYGYVSKGVTELNFIKTSKRNYEVVNIHITGSYSYDEIREKVKSSINASDRKNNFYKVILIGEVSEGFSIDETVLIERLKEDFYYCKVVDKTTIKYNIDELSKGYSVKSLFVKKMMKKLKEAEDNDEREIIELALKFGLKSLSESEIKAYDY